MKISDYFGICYLNKHGFSLFEGGCMPFIFALHWNKFFIYLRIKVWFKTYLRIVKNKGRMWEYDLFTKRNFRGGKIEISIRNNIQKKQNEF